MQFTVDQEPDSLAEYRSDFEELHEEIESLAIQLEQQPGDLEAVKQLRDILAQLRINSSTLSLVPIIENLELIVEVFDFMLEHQKYPPEFSEFLLILLD